MEKRLGAQTEDVPPSPSGEQAVHPIYIQPNLDLGSLGIRAETCSISVTRFEGRNAGRRELRGAQQRHDMMGMAHRTTHTHIHTPLYGGQATNVTDAVLTPTQDDAACRHHENERLTQKTWTIVSWTTKFS